MDKETARKHIEKNLRPGDSIVGFFYAIKPWSLWLFFLIGPLAILSMKYFFVAVTERGVYFHRLNMFGKFADNDFFGFREIRNVKIGKGIIQRPMKFRFNNDRSLKIKAMLKGVEKVAKLTESTQRHIESNIAVVE